MQDSSAARDEEHRRMRWASRRGMLELDLILEPFVDQRFASLGEKDRARYRQLMECQDQELFAWFLKRESPEDPELAAIVARVIAHARGDL
ncbi:MAG: succinate dehydrogenase assembly factor 2 [Halieaceae bacterium]|jgi:antitoxin CptB|nr:succinate dehydrogenase assembly factor 2 [Halieaceae bacterium]